jgi:hypothetical protein
VITLQAKILAHLAAGNKGTAEQIAGAIGAAGQTETVHLTLCHLAANPEHKVSAAGNEPLARVYQVG